MRKASVLSLLLILLSTSLLSAQDDFRFKPEQSTQLESRILTGMHGFRGSSSYRLLRFSGDTIIAGEAYQLVHGKRYAYRDYYNFEIRYIDTDYKTFAAIRQDAGGKVFARLFRPAANEFLDSHYDGIIEDEEHLLYDFSVETGDTVTWKTGFVKTVTSVDTIELENGELRKRIVFYREPGWEYSTDIWIAGMGSSKGLFGSLRLSTPPGGPYLNLTCSHDEATTLEYDFWQTEGVSSLSNNFNCRDDFFSSIEALPPAEHDMYIFPNPVRHDWEIVKIRTGYPAADIQSISIIDIQGRPLLELPIIDWQAVYYQTEFRLNAAAGVYLVVLELKTGERIVSRLLKY